MTPVTQTKVVVNNSKGECVIRGNCWAAVVASMLDLSITEVPNVEVLFHIDNYYATDVMHKFVESLGWEICNAPEYSCFHTVFTDDNYAKLDAKQKPLINKYYLVSGDSPRGVRHICIYKNGHLVHDPHPTKEGLISFNFFETLERTNK